MDLDAPLSITIGSSFLLLQKAEEFRIGFRQLTIVGVGPVVKLL